MPEKGWCKIPVSAESGNMRLYIKDTELHDKPAERQNKITDPGDAQELLVLMASIHMRITDQQAQGANLRLLQRP
jgi:hypothetical protein